MNYYYHFTYNEDYRWYETTFLFMGKPVKLLLPGYNSADFWALHQNLIRKIRWLTESWPLLEKKIRVHVNHPATILPLPQIQCISITVEPEEKLELLVQVKNPAFTQFVLAGINAGLEVEYLKTEAL
jgi:hypothetical protein